MKEKKKKTKPDFSHVHLGDDDHYSYNEDSFVKAPTRETLQIVIFGDDQTHIQVVDLLLCFTYMRMCIGDLPRKRIEEEEEKEKSPASS